MSVVSGGRMHFRVIVEIPKGSRNKYEMDHAKQRIRLDRMLFTATTYHYAHLPSPFFTRPSRLRLDQQRAHGEANLAINPLGPVGEAEVPAVEFAPARRISTVCGSATTMWATQPKSLMPAMRTMAPRGRGSATAAWASKLRRPSTGCSCSQPQRGEQPVVEPPPRAGRRLHPDGDLGDRSVRPRRSLDHDGHPAEGNVDDSPGQVACSEAPLCRGTTTHAPRARTAARVG